MENDNAIPTDKQVKESQAREAAQRAADYAAQLKNIKMKADMSVHGEGQKYGERK